MLVKMILEKMTHKKSPKNNLRSEHENDPEK